MISGECFNLMNDLLIPQVWEQKLYPPPPFPSSSSFWSISIYANFGHWALPHRTPINYTTISVDRLFLKKQPLTKLLWSLFPKTFTISFPNQFYFKCPFCSLFPTLPWRENLNQWGKRSLHLSLHTLMNTHTLTHSHMHAHPFLTQCTATYVY